MALQITTATVVVAQPNGRTPLVAGSMLIPAQQLSLVVIPCAYALQFTNLPAALTEINGGANRIVYDGTIFGQARVRAYIGTVANAGAVGRLQLSGDAGATFTTVGGSVALDALGAVDGTWGSVTADSLLTTTAVARIVTEGGDAAADPVVSFFVEFR